MGGLPGKSEQVARVHAGLIRRVVIAAGSRERVPDLEDLLRVSADNGWHALVAAIRRILAGARDPAAFRDLDDEDSLIVQHILAGIQNPDTLPDEGDFSDPTLAGPGLAAIVHAAATGDVHALRLLGDMAEQLGAGGGQLARLGSILRPLVNGERDAERLCDGMDGKGQALVQAILAELTRLESH